MNRLLFTEESKKNMLRINKIMRSNFLKLVVKMSSHSRWSRQIKSSKF